jgi:hypothetical protein
LFEYSINRSTRIEIRTDHTSQIVDRVLDYSKRLFPDEYSINRTTMFEIRTDRTSQIVDRLLDYSKRLFPGQILD